MVERLTVSETAVRLSSSGYPIGRRYLAELVRAGKGPPFSCGPSGSHKNVVLIRWDDALTWGRNCLGTRGLKPDMLISAAAIGPMDRDLAIDQIIFYLKSNRPEEWQRVLGSIHKADRRELLNHLGDQVIEYVETLWRVLVAHHCPMT